MYVSFFPCAAAVASGYHSRRLLARNDAVPLTAFPARRCSARLQKVSTLLFIRLVASNVVTRLRTRFSSSATRREILRSHPRSTEIRDPLRYIQIHSDALRYIEVHRDLRRSLSWISLTDARYRFPGRRQRNPLGWRLALLSVTRYLRFVSFFRFFISPQPPACPIRLCLPHSCFIAAS